MVAMLQSDIPETIARARESHEELLLEYRKCLDDKCVSARAVHLTHEIFEKLRRLLDRVAHRYWANYIRPSLPADLQKKDGRIYFPIGKSEHDFDSMMGRWPKVGNLRTDHSDFYAALLNLQPFRTGDNRLLLLSEISNSSHVELLPQKYWRSDTFAVVERRSDHAVMRATWNTNAVRFSQNPNCTVRICGQVLNPVTQTVAAAPGLTQRFECWEGFLISPYGINALHFAKTIIDQVASIATELARQFAL